MENKNTNDTVDHKRSISVTPVKSIVPKRTVSEPPTTLTKLEKLQDEMQKKYPRAKVLIHKADLKPEVIDDMIDDAFIVLNSEFGKEEIWEESEVARELKLVFDCRHGPQEWHAFVGRRFDWDVSHEKGYFLAVQFGRMIGMVFVSKKTPKIEPEKKKKKKKKQRKAKKEQKEKEQ